MVFPIVRKYVIMTEKTKVGMNTLVTVKSIAELREVVEEFNKNSMHPEGEDEYGRKKYFPPITWFRGHSNSEYKLIPSLYRQNFDSGKEANPFLEFERRAYKAFIHGCIEQNIEIGTNSWERLYLMQHYGVKTRLLDWSSKLSIASFFAYSGWNQNKTSASIWLLDPIGLNWVVKKTSQLVSAKDSDEFSYVKYLEARNAGTLAIEPTAATEEKNSRSTVNRRIKKQHGKFTIHDTKWPLEAEIEIRLASTSNHIVFNQIHVKDIIKQVILSPEMHSEIQNKLNEKGINYSFVYPDLEGIALDANRVSLEI